MGKIEKTVRGESLVGSEETFATGMVEEFQTDTVKAFLGFATDIFNEV